MEKEYKSIFTKEERSKEVVKGHGTKCRKCDASIFTVNVSSVKKIIVDENGVIIGEEPTPVSRGDVAYPYSTVKTCLTCGELNKIGDWK